jgi:uncharacterized protein YrzB (UPF0473 family)
MIHGENNITVVDENGNEQLCEVLFTFDSEEFGKWKYMLLHLSQMKMRKMGN